MQLVVYDQSMVVSVPEKVLEHWSSQYLTYRYRSKMALWWPPKGEDIEVRRLPIGPGKAVQLEMKTTEVTPGRPSQHDVVVDLGQLWEYCRRPHAYQPFYVFPRPDWPGKLEDVAALAGRPVTELGFARSGYNWWFADWMIALTTQDVARVLHTELAAHGSRKRGKKARLVRFDLNANPRWGSNGTSPEVIKLRKLWSSLELCGRDHWPQIIRLPAQINVSPGRPYHADELSWFVALDYQRSNVPFESWEDFVTLESDGQGGFVLEDRSIEADRMQAEENYFAFDIDNRQVVFLDWSTLKV